MKRITKLLIGPPKDPTDTNVLRHLTLIAFFAWVGLGADGLSSSCYGPQEAFLAPGEHTHLIWPLAALVAITILVISASYTQVVSLFPAGGGGYIVATKLLGRTPGIVSGSSLLVDYVLTISISVASGVDAFFSFLPISWQKFKLAAVILSVLGLIALNLRGVKESIKILLPIFMMFVLTHIALILAGLFQSGTLWSNYSQSADVIQADAAQRLVGAGLHPEKAFGSAAARSRASRRCPTACRSCASRRRRRRGGRCCTWRSPSPSRRRACSSLTSSGASGTRRAGR
jgi:amino acid transporter